MQMYTYWSSICVQKNGNDPKEPLCAQNELHSSHTVQSLTQCDFSTPFVFVNISRLSPAAHPPERKKLQRGYLTTRSLWCFLYFTRLETVRIVSPNSIAHLARGPLRDGHDAGCSETLCCERCAQRGEGVRWRVVRYCLHDLQPPPTRTPSSHPRLHRSHIETKPVEGSECRAGSIPLAQLALRQYDTLGNLHSDVKSRI